MHSDRALRARRIRVVCQEGKTGLFYATSPDLKGLLVAEPSRAALEDAIPQAIEDLYRASGEDVLVTPLDQGDEAEASWVAFPAVAIRSRDGRAALA